MSAPELVQITDYTTRVLGFLISQYRDSTRLQGVITAGTEEADKIEASMFQVDAGFSMDNAIGVQLDILGRVFRESRQGRSDDDFRVAIKLKASIAVNGSPEEILTFLRNLSLTAPTDLEYQFEGTGKYAILTDDETFATGALDRISPAGVQGAFGNPILDALGNPMTDALGRKLYTVRA